MAAKIAVIGYLGSDRMPALLGLLIRRLRSLMPGRVVVLGLWSLSDNPSLAEEWRQTIGAEHVVTNVRDAARVCLELQDSLSPQTYQKSLRALATS
jgi:hypothetical protein